MELSDFKDIFSLRGDFVSVGPYGNGHINDTYAAVYNQAGKEVRYIHQRINSSVFKDVPGLMKNISLVTSHIQERLGRENTPYQTRRSLTLLESSLGLPYFIDSEGFYWRTYLFIEGARTYDRTESRTQAREAASAYGLFQTWLSDLNAEDLVETIPGFHDTRQRFEALREAVEMNPEGRLEAVKRHVDWFYEREAIVDRINTAMAEGHVPRRIAHNDTKINNVMLDNTTMEGVCVIDLDTVMPGSCLFDFGDMVRSVTNTANEDERDVSKVSMDFSLFEAILEGYLSNASSFLTATERSLLPFSGKLITYEIGLRFLTDYLLGDVYFKTHWKGQNLARCQVHMALVESIERQMNAMEDLVMEHV